MRKVLYIFGTLTDSDIEWIAHNGTRRRLRDGEVVIEEGETIDSVILLLDGQFAVNAKGRGEIARLGVGEIVGEISLIDSEPPSATVTALGPCFALFLPKALLLRKLETDMAFGCRFYRALAIFLADRLRAMRSLPTAGERGIAGIATVLQDELDPGLLDTITYAGERFRRMITILSGLKH